MRGLGEEGDDPLEDIMPDLKRGRYEHPVHSLLFPLDPSAVRGEGSVQCASYAAELLSGTYGSRVSCFGVVVVDDLLFFWHYDPTSIVYTAQKLSFILDFEAAAAAILAIADCTAERFGAIPSSVMEPPQPYPQIFPPCTLRGYSFSMPSVDGRNAFRCTLQDPVNTSYGLTGRRSFIYTATIRPTPDGYSKNSVIVKFSYQLNTRQPENAIVKLAHDSGIDHIPDIHAYEDLWLLEDGRRTMDQRCRSTMERHGAVTDTDNIEEKRYEDRVLRATAYTAYESIRVLFKEKWELIPLMVDQMIDCE